MAKPRRRANVKLLGVVRRRRPALLVSTALCATVTMVVSLPAAAQPAANAHPTGGVVVGGSASISQHQRQPDDRHPDQPARRDQLAELQCRQPAAQVQFVQPSSSAVTLNKVVGPNPSQIAGQIDANGQIIIENQSGVMFYKGSQVNTAGLMVTAAASGNAATQAFINGGQLALDQAAHPNAMVVNQGQITIKQAGLAALVAPQVANSGVITAKLGTVVLAGGVTQGDARPVRRRDAVARRDRAGGAGAERGDGAGDQQRADRGRRRHGAADRDGGGRAGADAGERRGARSRRTASAATTGTVTLNAVGGSVTVVGQLGRRGHRAGHHGRRDRGELPPAT